MRRLGVAVFVRLFGMAGILLAAAQNAAADEDSALRPKEIVPGECLVIKPVGRYGRSVVRLDALEAQMLAGKWKAPKAGEAVTLPDGKVQAWETAQVGKDGWFRHGALAGGYAYVSVPADTERVMVLEASGHGMVYVNGEPRTGDPYQTGYVRLPVLLRQGTNDFLFHGARGRVRMKLVEPKSSVLLDGSDATLPDLVVGEETKTWAALVVINNTTGLLDQLAIRARCGEGARPTFTSLPPLPPLSTRKLGFRLEGAAPKEEGQRAVQLELTRGSDEQVRTLDKQQVFLRVRRPEQTHKRTFRSTIDGSVQYYAVNPARPVTKAGEPRSEPALFLTLHGAGVEAIGQVEAYSPKSWGHLVAPTNRRPYGFDWEDWGRLDALEVLDQAQKQLHSDPRRTYLTGHSMGGHGTWHLGAIFPDRFAAIGPSAGWISFWSYAGGKRPGNPTAMQEMLQRAASPSNTLALAKNYLHQGVYILHGAADDNVPADQARTMKQQLSDFHHDFVYHEQPGAGHWWDVSDEPGTDCVDWAPMFDFFARRLRPGDDSVRQIDFITANPGVSARCHWLAIEAQILPLKPSSVSIRHDPGRRRFVGTTHNVARLALDLGHVQPGSDLTIDLDGQKLPATAYPEKGKRIWLKREAEKWLVMGEPSSSLKGPHRYGPFKDAFRNRVLFVYGTVGNPDEQAWAFAKARCDAETFWYRGNGSVEVIPDKSFDASADPDRNVILYGNAETNGAWKTLLADSPIQVRRGQVSIGERQESGDDLACLFLRPRPGSDRAVVAAVSGSGLPGLRLTERLGYFVSGVGFPDLVVIGSDTLSRGDAGVRAAGFFGLDWRVASGEFLWRP
jgi:dienelactone hydrolase